MHLRQFFLEQLEREAAASRKTLERVPEGRNDFKPHERSMELGYLAGLVASMPAWPALIVDRDELDLNGPPGETFRAQPMQSRAQLLSTLDDSLARSRAALLNTTDDHLMLPWRLVAGPVPLAHGIRHVVIAETALSHMAHHRGQLTVYLRLLDVPVPALYGPSADERQ